MAKKKKVQNKKQSAGFFETLVAPARTSTSATTKSKQATLSFDEYIPEIQGSSVLKGIGALLVLIGVLQVFELFGNGGYVGTLIQTFFVHVFGVVGYLSFALFLYVGVYMLLARLPRINIAKLFWGMLFVLVFLAVPNMQSGLQSTVYGGLAGNILAVPFQTLFSYYPGLIFLVLLGGYSIVALFGKTIAVSDIMSIKDKMSHSTRPRFGLPSFITNMWHSKTKAVVASPDDEYIDEDTEAADIRAQMLGTPKRKEKKIAVSEQERAEEVYIERSSKRQESINTETNSSQKKSDKKTVATLSTFVPPPLSLLQRDSGKASVGDTKANMSIIKRTLADFGIQVEMDEVSIGPSVTRYTLKPAQGVKLSRIANHRQELAYALRAESVRIEAPIPGKALVGIEIPNESKSMVGMASLLSSPGWEVADKPLLVALGKGISGTALFSNLAKMPHLLIAGTTGSGKSVMVHTIINSLLFRNSPEDLKFIMVDPKKVELTLYNNIPHLYTPVITNPKVTIRTLGWAVNEMERRYDVLEENGVRDIATYQKDIYQKALKARKNEDDEVPSRMPYIVIIIDELADIMMSYPKELESAIVRLAQKSRAVGIHLILSTQRPSVNVITGLIKANIPSRIALKVASQIDSRTIIDTAGAEQLLGQGDLLFTSSESPKQERVQSPFVSDGEVKRVVEYLKNAYRDSVPDEINLDDNKGADKGMQALFGTDLGSVGGGDTDDDLFEEAREIVISSRKASTSYLQRRLKVGYSRAARLMDMLEEQGVIGPGDGAKPREVLAGASHTEQRDMDEDESLS
jgi:S-DNA-T family DNA segregation ATPase FtsK/SpoIIIE